MKACPISESRLRTSIDRVFGADDTESTFEKAKKAIKDTGIRIPTIFCMCVVDRSRKFGPHLIVKAVVEENPEAGTELIRFLRISPTFNVLEQFDRGTKEAKPTRQKTGRVGYGQNPRIQMGDFNS